MAAAWLLNPPRITPGLRAAEVEQILGAPDVVTQFKACEVWYYESAAWDADAVAANTVPKLVASHEDLVNPYKARQLLITPDGVLEAVVVNGESTHSLTGKGRVAGGMLSVR